ncbi:MAG: histidine phosphatase family protein [Actinobacteria bacterium]|nr:histidine phosphatase family protein [Actinomycetota bacterium]
MTTLILVRHGETDWNAQHRWQGHSDTELNDAGREQARRLAEGLGRVDALYSSDLSRARETAEILAGTIGVEVRFDQRLRERGFGAWEGLTTEEIESSFPDEQRRWRAGIGAGAHNAEPFEAFAARVGSFVEEIGQRHVGEEVLVVAHGGTIRVVHALAAGIDYVRDHRSIPAVANCSSSRYAFRGGRLSPID